MYKTTRTIAGDASMTCKDCGHQISMNKMCERPIQTATDMLNIWPLTTPAALLGWLRGSWVQKRKPSQRLSQCPLSQLCHGFRSRYRLTNPPPRFRPSHVCDLQKFD